MFLIGAGEFLAKQFLKIILGFPGDFRVEGIEKIPVPGLAAAGKNVVLVGDCYSPRSLLAATRQGYQVGM